MRVSDREETIQELDQAHRRSRSQVTANSEANRSDIPGFFLYGKEVDERLRRVFPALFHHH